MTSCIHFSVASLHGDWLSDVIWCAVVNDNLPRSAVCPVIHNTQSGRRRHLEEFFQVCVYR